MPFEVSNSSRPGPASEVYYAVPDSDLNVHPDLDYPSKFRSELSLAFSRVYFTSPHVFIEAIKCNLPIWSDLFFDADAYQEASMLYFGRDTPYNDLARCISIIRPHLLPRLRQIVG
jgi:hypothetical protein